MLFFLEERTTPMMAQSLLMLDFCSLQIFVAFSVDVLKISDGCFLSLHKVIWTWLPLFLKFTLKGFLQLGFGKHVNIFIEIEPLPSWISLISCLGHWSLAIQGPNVVCGEGMVGYGQTFFAAISGTVIYWVLNYTLFCKQFIQSMGSLSGFKPLFSFLLWYLAMSSWASY